MTSLQRLKRQWPQLSELLLQGIPLQCLIGQLPRRLLSLLSAHEQPFEQHQSWSSSCWNILYFRMSGCSNGFNRLSAFTLLREAFVPAKRKTSHLSCHMAPEFELILPSIQHDLQKDAYIISSWPPQISI